MKRAAPQQNSDEESEQQRRRLEYDQACRLIGAGSSAAAIPLLRGRDDAASQALLAGALIANPAASDAGEVVRLVRASAAAENPHSMCFQATLLLLSQKGDPAVAVKIMRRAAQLGSSEAVRQLGLMHTEGLHGVPADARLGHHLLSLAGAMGSRPAAKEARVMSVRL